MISPEECRLVKTVLMANQLAFSDLILTLREEERLKLESTLAIRLASIFCPDPGQKVHLQEQQLAQDLV